MQEAKRPLKVFPSTGSGHRLCHAHADRDAVRTLYARLTNDGVNRYAWLDKEKPCGERNAVLSLSKHRTILPVQDLEILKAVL